jgi:hypothetical protein
MGPMHASGFFPSRVPSERRLFARVDVKATLLEICYSMLTLKLL